jgi:hypothetical protein
MAKVLSSKIHKCMMCGFSTHHVSAIQTHYTTTLHKQKILREFHQENQEREMMNLEDARTNKPVKRVTFKERMILEHRLHVENENNVIRKLIHCDDYTKNIILREIVEKQYSALLKHMKKIPPSILIKIYDGTINLFIAWNRNKRWFDAKANVRYIDNFNKELNNCLKEKKMQTFEEYNCRLQILNFKDIIEKNYDLMMNYEW